MSMLKAAMQALDFGNAVSWAKMGLRNKQTFDVFGAYIRGVELPRGGRMAIDALQGLPSRLGVGAARTGLLGFGALATWNMLPRNNTLAIPAGVGAGIGTAYGMGRIPHIAQGAKWAGGLRAAGGLLAGSLVYQGLRAAGPSEYQVNM